MNFSNWLCWLIYFYFTVNGTAVSGKECLGESYYGRRVFNEFKTKRFYFNDPLSRSDEDLSTFAVESVKKLHCAAPSIFKGVEFIVNGLLSWIFSFLISRRIVFHLSLQLNVNYLLSIKLQ